jgi:hypothetical protein
MRLGDARIAALRELRDDLRLIVVGVRRDETDGLRAGLAQHPIEREDRGRRRDACRFGDPPAQRRVGIEAEARALAAVP